MGPVAGVILNCLGRGRMADWDGLEANRRRILFHLNIVKNGKLMLKEPSSNVETRESERERERY